MRTCGEVWQSLSDLLRQEVICTWIQNCFNERHQITILSCRFYFVSKKIIFWIVINFREALAKTFVHAKLKQRFLEHENEPPPLYFIGIHFLAEGGKIISWEIQANGNYKIAPCLPIIHLTLSTNIPNHRKELWQTHY